MNESSEALLIVPQRQGVEGEGSTSFSDDASYREERKSLMTPSSSSCRLRGVSIPVTASPPQNLKLSPHKTKYLMWMLLLATSSMSVIADDSIIRHTTHYQSHDDNSKHDPDRVPHPSYLRRLSATRVTPSTTETENPFLIPTLTLVAIASILTTIILFRKRHNRRGGRNSITTTSLDSKRKKKKSLLRFFFRKSKHHQQNKPTKTKTNQTKTSQTPPITPLSNTNGKSSTIDSPLPSPFDDKMKVQVLMPDNTNTNHPPTKRDDPSIQSHDTSTLISDLTSTRSDFLSRRSQPLNKSVQSVLKLLHCVNDDNETSPIQASSTQESFSPSLDSTNDNICSLVHGKNCHLELKEESVASPSFEYEGSSLEDDDSISDVEVDDPNVEMVLVPKEMEEQSRRTMGVRELSEMIGGTKDVSQTSVIGNGSSERQKRIRVSLGREDDSKQRVKKQLSLSRLFRKPKSNSRAKSDSVAKSKSARLWKFKSKKKDLVVKPEIVVTAKNEEKTNKPNLTPTKVESHPSKDTPEVKPLPKKPRGGNDDAKILQANVKAETEIREIQKNLWRTATDKNTGNEYYYHTQTLQTTWDKPPELQVKTKPPEKERAITPSIPPFNPMIWAKKMRIAKMLAAISPDEAESNDQLMDQYDGREDELILQLQALMDQTPFDEPSVSVSLKSDESERKIVPVAVSKTPSYVVMSSPGRGVSSRKLQQETTESGSEFELKSNKTEKVSNRKTNPSAVTVPDTTFDTTPDITPPDPKPNHPTSTTSNPSTIPTTTTTIHPNSSTSAYSTTTTTLPNQPPSSSSHHGGPFLALDYIPYKPEPRKRELRAEEYAGRGYALKSEKFNSRRCKKTIKKSNFVPPGKIGFDTSEEASGSVSELSGSYCDLKKRSDLEIAVKERDWERATVMAQGLRGGSGGMGMIQQSFSDPSDTTQSTNEPTPPPIPPTTPTTTTPPEWTQTELDRFISQNDWDSVIRCVAVMRNGETTSSPPKQCPTSPSKPVSILKNSNYVPTPTAPQKTLGARSKLQHKDIPHVKYRPSRRRKRLEEEDWDGVVVVSDQTTFGPSPEELIVVEEEEEEIVRGSESKNAVVPMDTKPLRRMEV